MRAIIYGIITIWLMGLHNVIIKEKLAGYDPLAIALLFYLGALPIVIAGLIFKKAAGMPVVWPTDPLVFAWAVFGGALYVLADVFYLSAYGAGGEVMVITSIAILLPVFSVIIQNVWNRQWVMPNGWEIAGYLLIIAGLAALAKGGMFNKAAE